VIKSTSKRKADFFPGIEAGYHPGKKLGKSNPSGSSEESPAK
jgi:hypothetical protein